MALLRSRNATLPCPFRLRIHATGRRALRIGISLGGLILLLLILYLLFGRG
jgi:hypothetical protein